MPACNTTTTYKSRTADHQHIRSQVLTLSAARLRKPVHKRIVSCRMIVASHLRVDLRDHPLQALAAVARIRADAIGQQILHVMAERHAVHVYVGFLAQQRLGGIGGVRRIVEHLVDGDVPAERQVVGFQRHHTVVGIDDGPFARIADLRRANDLCGFGGGVGGRGG